MLASPATETRYIVQTYILDKKSNPVPSMAHICETQMAAERRAEKVMNSGKIIGVHLICQTGIPEFDEYEEPVVMLALGRVPPE